MSLFTGGKIDHAHHAALAEKAFDETVEFAKAVELARKRTSEENTLIVVTSDHSHTMSIAGYSVRKFQLWMPYKVSIILLYFRVEEMIFWVSVMD